MLIEHLRGSRGARRAPRPRCRLSENPSSGSRRKSTSRPSRWSSARAPAHSRRGDVARSEALGQLGLGRPYATGANRRHRHDRRGPGGPWTGLAGTTWRKTAGAGCDRGRGFGQVLHRRGRQLLAEQDRREAQEREGQARHRSGSNEGTGHGTSRRRRNHGGLTACARVAWPGPRPRIPPPAAHEYEPPGRSPSSRAESKIRDAERFRAREILASSFARDSSASAMLSSSWLDPARTTNRPQRRSFCPRHAPRSSPRIPRPCSTARGRTSPTPRPAAEAGPTPPDTPYCGPPRIAGVAASGRRPSRTPRSRGPQSTLLALRTLERPGLATAAPRRPAPRPRTPDRRHRGTPTRCNQQPTRSSACRAAPRAR